MLKSILGTLLVFFPLNLYSAQNVENKTKDQKSQCFYLYDLQNSKIIKEIDTGLCKEQTTPNSSFKIALSLMAFQEGILKTETDPKLKFKKEYLPEGVKDWMPKQWTEDTDARNWLQFSVVWFSEYLVEKLSKDKINKYLNEFNYGNKNFDGISGNEKKMKIPWIDSSLKITAKNQLEFLTSVVREEFKLNKHTYEMTKKALFSEQENKEVKLYAKTGAGFDEKERAHSWYVGWIEKANKKYIFVNQFRDTKPSSQMNVQENKKIVLDILKNNNFL